MLSVFVEGNSVKIEVDTGVGVYRYYHFSHQFTGPYDTLAHILAAHIQRRLDDRVVEIRHAAYEAGWADAKAKRKRKTEFSTSFDG